MSAHGAQLLFDYAVDKDGRRLYRSILTARENGKGCLDVDTVKGCTLGMKAYPRGGCYGECYAYKDATRYGITFGVAVSRRATPGVRDDVFCAVRDHGASWYRVGVAGDPCHDWENTLSVCEFLGATHKVAVIITKHWTALTDEQMRRLAALRAVVNTSTSGMDSDGEIAHRVEQMERLRAFGVSSVCRVVTCKYGASEWARKCKERQDYLLSITPIIDNPLRASRSNYHVAAGDIMLERMDGAIGGGKFVSLHSAEIYLGTCKRCPDQCGVTCPRNNETHANNDNTRTVLAEN